MTFYYLIVLGISCFFTYTNAQISSCNEEYNPQMNLSRQFFVEEQSHKGKPKLPISVQSPDSEVATDHRSWRIIHARIHHRHLRVVHGTINIVGWGILMPAGVIVARYYRRFPLECNEWYSLHILSHISGFILGTIGWGLGISIRNAAKVHTLSAHGLLGTIIFAITILQVSAMSLQPDEEHKYRKYWVLCHQLLGYVLIALIIANIFEGIDKQNLANKWRWSYGVIAGILALTAFTLEFLKWSKSYR